MINLSHDQNEEEFKEFLAFWNKKYVKDITEISEQPLKFVKKESCNSGKFYICKTKEQVQQILNKYYNQYSSEAKSFYEYCKKNVAYDGLVFSTTRKLLEICEKFPDNYSYKYAYLNNFGFVANGFFCQKIENKDEHIQNYSSYPFELDDTK